MLEQVFTNAAWNNNSHLHTAIDQSVERDGPQVVAILPRGEAIRNFVYSGALDQINQAGRLTVLSVLPSGETQALLTSRYQNIYELQERKEAHIVNSLREILEMAHGRWLWSEAAKERWRLRDLEAVGFKNRLKRLVKKATCYPFANTAGLKALSRVERAASKWFRTTDEYIRLFQGIQPSLVFNGSHIHSRIAVQAVQAAQWLGIPTATFLFSWDNLTSQGRLIPTYDYYLVWNEAIREQLLAMYNSIRPEQVVVTGTPQFDFHFREEYFWSREEFCERVGADSARPIILYSTGMANHMPGEPEIVEGIANTLREMREFGPPQLLVRVYPKDLTGRFETLKRQRPDILFPEIPWEANWLTPKIEDLYLLTNTLRHAAAGINVASTISLELCMFDKPVINIGYNPDSVDPNVLDYSRYYLFNHYRPVVESKAVQVAYSEPQVKEMLREALSDPQKASAERQSFVRRMFGETLDGRSGDRISEQLLTLAGDSRSLHL